MAMFYNLERLMRRRVSQFYRATDTSILQPGPRFLGPCPCCGGLDIVQKDILSDNLIDIWDLSQVETDYINRQQGLQCTSCGSRLRSMALAAWLCRHFGAESPLSELTNSPVHAPQIKVLEINEAGQLTQFLRKLPQHTLACYPDVDIMNLPYMDETFDLVVHSDTLEHVPDPVRALAECKRVLQPNGHCAFTVPVVVDRLSRSTDRGLPSYHGNADLKAEDFKVRSEFGADTWKTALSAGFMECSLFALEYPAALVHICKK